EDSNGVIQNLLFGVVQVHHRHIEANLVLDRRPKVRQAPSVLRLGPRIHRTLQQGLGAVRNHQLHVVVDGVSETLTALASTERIVETEQARLRSGEALPALLASE